MGDVWLKVKWFNWKRRTRDLWWGLIIWWWVVVLSFICYPLEETLLPLIFVPACKLLVLHHQNAVTSNVNHHFLMFHKFRWVNHNPFDKSFAKAGCTLYKQMVQPSLSIVIFCSHKITIIWATGYALTKLWQITTFSKIMILGHNDAWWLCFLQHEALCGSSSPTKFPMHICRQGRSWSKVSRATA